MFLDLFYVLYIIQHCFICSPSDSTVSEDVRNLQENILGRTPKSMHMEIK